MEPLHEGHVPHGYGMADLAWLSSYTSCKLLSCGADGNLLVTDPATAKAETVAVNKTAKLTCLAVHPSGVSLAVGDDANFVKVFKLPSGNFEKVATRFSLPVRAVVFSPSGTSIAAAGDDDGIKLVNIADSKVFRTLKAGPYTRSLAYECDGKYLASVSANGLLQIWDTTTGVASSLQKAAPKVDSASTLRCGLAWHPDGSLLAVSDTNNGVTLYEKLSWDQVIHLDGHTAPINCLSFSPNGLYIVSACQESKVIIWDLAKRDVLARCKTASVLSALAWHPSKDENILAGISQDGSIALWKGAIPDHCTKPADMEGPSPSLTAHNEDEVAADIDDDLDADMSTSPAEHSEDAEDTGGVSGESGEPARPTIRAQPKLERRERPVIQDAKLRKLQDAIQPGSTPTGDGKRRWLAYNVMGCISSREDDGFCVVEITFHDTSRNRKRIPLLNDFYHFSMASLGAQGALYASTSSADAPSMVMFRPFESWAPNSDWTVGLPAGEEACAVAAGGSLCAVATSRQFLRIFSAAGLQLGIISIPGRIVALAAHGDLVTVAWHQGMPAQDGDQSIAYSVYRVDSQLLLHTGALCLSPKSRLAWFGFSEEAMLVTYDSAGVMRLRTPAYGGSWVPVFEASKDCSESQTCWPIGISALEIYCIITPANSNGPQVLPRPVMSVLPLHIPVVAMDAGISQLEADVLRQNIYVAHLKGQEGTWNSNEEEIEIEVAQKDADRALLKVFHAALKSGKVARALEAAAQLVLPVSLQGALKLANHHRVTALAERVQYLIEEASTLDEPEPHCATPVPGSSAGFSHRNISSEDNFPAARSFEAGGDKMHDNEAFKRPLNSQLLRERTANMADTGKLHSAGNIQSPSKLLGEKRKESANNPFARKPKVAKS